MTDLVRLRLAYATLYEMLKRIGSPDDCPTADEIEKTLAQLEMPAELGDLILAALPHVNSQLLLLAIERTAMQRHSVVFTRTKQIGEVKK